MNFDGSARCQDFDRLMDVIGKMRERVPSFEIDLLLVKYKSSERLARAKRTAGSHSTILNLLFLFRGVFGTWLQDYPTPTTATAFAWQDVPSTRSSGSDSC